MEQLTLRTNRRDCVDDEEKGSREEGKRGFFVKEGEVGWPQWSLMWSYDIHVLDPLSIDRKYYYFMFVCNHLVA